MKIIIIILLFSQRIQQNDQYARTLDFHTLRPRFVLNGGLRKGKQAQNPRDLLTDSVW